MKNLFLTLLLTLQANAGTPFLDETTISFKKDIRPIFKQACTKCHNGSNKLPDITKYQVAFDLKNEIVARVTSDKTMPMYGKLSESNRELIKLWVEQGAKK